VPVTSIHQLPRRVVPGNSASGVFRSRKLVAGIKGFFYLFPRLAGLRLLCVLAHIYRIILRARPSSPVLPYPSRGDLWAGMKRGPGFYPGLQPGLWVGGTSVTSRLVLRLAKLGVSAARGGLVAYFCGRSGCSSPTVGRTAFSWEGSGWIITPRPFRHLIRITQLQGWRLTASER
jgi:hypothetical protein